jgi:hypothetical protein
VPSRVDDPVVVLVTEAAIDVLLDEEHPELAIVAAWVMQNRHGPAAVQVVTRAVGVTSHLPPELRDHQMRAILQMLTPRLLEKLREKFMQADDLTERPEQRTVRLLIERVFREIDRVKAEGKAEGRLESAVASLLAVLETRGLALSAAQRAQVDACPDWETMLRWTQRAVTASNADEIFA